jgi:Ser/Thr protein kinase RdoA (MazF antagonist)
VSIDTKTPYANLDPHLILDAVESAGFQCSGGMIALNSFENRVYQIGIEDAEPVILSSESLV